MSVVSESEMFAGVTRDGRVAISTNDGTGVSMLTMDLASAEWLRDRLFHICAHERALLKQASEEKRP